MRVRLVASFQMDYPGVGEETHLEADEAEVFIAQSRRVAEKFFFDFMVFLQQRMISPQQRRLNRRGKVRRPLHAHVLRAAVESEIVVFGEMF